MLEQTSKSSRLSAYLQKLHMDFYAKSSMEWGRANTDEEIDPAKVRTGLFALVTARLEDAHEVTVSGQLENATTAEVAGYINDVRSNLDEIRIHFAALELINTH